MSTYAVDHQDDLMCVWETERPFELHLDDVTITGRADAILDNEDGVITGLAIVDYKTSTDGLGGHDLQLQVYADAGRREGLDVRAAYVHDPEKRDRFSVDVAPSAITGAEAKVTNIVERLKRRDFPPARALAVPIATCARSAPPGADSTTARFDENRVTKYLDEAGVALLSSREPRQ